MPRVPELKFNGQSLLPCDEGCEALSPSPLGKRQCAVKTLATPVSVLSLPSPTNQTPECALAIITSHSNADLSVFALLHVHAFMIMALFPQPLWHPPRHIHAPALCHCVTCAFSQRISLALHLCIWKGGFRTLRRLKACSTCLCLWASSLAATNVGGPLWETCNVQE